MNEKRVRIWNSKLAYHVDTQLKSTAEKAIFRKMLTQNSLDERFLRRLLQRWHRHGQNLSFIAFLIDAELLSVRSLVSSSTLHFIDAADDTLVNLQIDKCDASSRSSIGFRLKRFLERFASQFRLQQISSTFENLGR